MSYAYDYDDLQMQAHFVKEEHNETYEDHHTSTTALLQAGVLYEALDE